MQQDTNGITTVNTATAMPASRGASFLGGVQAGTYPGQQTTSFTPTSVFDKSQVVKAANGNSVEDQSRKMMGGAGAAATPNGQSETTFDDRRWTGGNNSRSFG